MLFLGDALTSLIAVFLVWKNIKETYMANNKVKVENKAEVAEKENTFQMLWKRPALSLFLVLYTVYNFIYV